MIAEKGVLVGRGELCVSGRSKTITGKITQLLHGGVGGGHRQIVSKNAFHDYCGTNVSTHTNTPTYPLTLVVHSPNTVHTHTRTCTREHEKR